MKFSIQKLRELVDTARNGPQGLDVNDPDYVKKLDDARIDARCEIEGNALTIVEHLLNSQGVAVECSSS
jgi:hypothetical protein